MDKSLSNKEVLKLINGKANYLNYREFTKYDNIFDAMGPHKALILLYLSSFNYGHFVCIFQRDNVIEFFDSLGFDMPDDEFKFINPEQRIINNEAYPHVIKLLFKSGLRIENNIDKLQKMKSKTCGRHVACRLRLRNMNIDDYVKLMKSTNLSPDELVYYITDVI